VLNDEVGIDKNVSFEPPTENRQRLHGSDVFRKIVPHLRTGHRKSPVTDWVLSGFRTPYMHIHESSDMPPIVDSFKGGTTKQLYQQNGGGLSTRMIGDMNPEVPRCIRVENFVDQ
jgi:hypothetical protein